MVAIAWHKIAKKKFLFTPKQKKGDVDVGGAISEDVCPVGGTPSGVEERGVLHRRERHPEAVPLVALLFGKRKTLSVSRQPRFETICAGSPVSKPLRSKN